MEAPENCVQNGQCSENEGTMELAVQQKCDDKKQNLLKSIDDDKKTFEFEADFNGNGSCYGDEYDENDDRSYEIK